MGALMGSSQASDYYYFDTLPGLVLSDSTYPFCSVEDCTYTNENGVSLSFDNDYQTAGIDDTDVVQGITFNAGTNGAELRISVSDSNIISAESISLAGGNTSITLPSFTAGGTVNITLTAREGTDVVAQDTLELFVSNHGDAFVTTWDVNAGDTVEMPTRSGYTYNGSISWDNGATYDAFTSYDDYAAFSHTYVTAGTYTVIVEGTFEALNTGLKCSLKMRTVEQLGKVGWETLYRAFYCANLASFTAGNVDTTSVTSMDEMFAWAFNLTSLDLSGFDTTSVTNMDSMFFGASSLTSLDLSGFDASSVTTMYSMFLYTTSLTSLEYSVDMINSYSSILALFADQSLTGVTFNPGVNICEEDSSCLEYKDYLKGSLDWTFVGDTTVPENIDYGDAFVTKWNVGAGDSIIMPTTSGYTYNGYINWGDGTGDSAFTSYNDVDFTHTYTNAGIYTVSISGTFEALNTANKYTLKMRTVEQLGKVGWETLENAFSASNLALFIAGNVDTSSVTRMNSMFYNASGLTSLDLSGFDTTYVTSMNMMFYGANNLTEITYNEPVNAALYGSLLSKVGDSSIANDALPPSGITFNVGENLCNGDTACDSGEFILKDTYEWIFQ